MHPRILAQRHTDAIGRMVRAARKLARHHGLLAEARALESAQSRLPAVQAMMQAEAIADLLEAATAQMADSERAESESQPAAPTKATKPIGTARKDK